MIISLIIDQKTIYAIFLADQPKLFYRTRDHFLDTRYDPSSQPALPIHLGLISKEEDLAEEEAQQVEAQKQKGEINRLGHCGTRQVLLIIR